MEKITSFTIDHNKLVPGLYVSRKDHVEGAVITTFDIRMTNPNEEPVMNTAEMHTIEHLAATFLRNHSVYGKKLSILVQWDVVPVSICFLPEITSPSCFGHFFSIIDQGKGNLRMGQAQAIENIHDMG